MSITPTAIEGPLTATERAAFELFGEIPAARLINLVTISVSSRQKTLSKSVAVALLSARGEAEKVSIEDRSGHALSSAQAAARLGRSSETIRTLVSAGKLIGYQDLSERRRIRLPEWQFAGAGEVHAWVFPLIAAYGGNGWPLLDFLSAPRTGLVAGKRFSGESLLDHIRAGDVAVALEAARRANPE